MSETIQLTLKSGMGPAGKGVPAGGTAGQVLAKIDGNDYNTQWTSGGGGSVVSVNGQTGVVTLAKADIGLGNVDNTSDANKPISTATQTALNTKQATLVSGANLKTVNSTTLLGSGDLAVQPTLVSGTNIKTVNGNTLLGSGDLTVSGGAGWTVAGAFSSVINLSSSNTILPPTSVTGAIDFTLTGTPSPFIETYVRLTANGTNIPTFSGFTVWPGSGVWDNVNGHLNHISFFSDNNVAYYAVTPDSATAFDPSTKQDTLVSGTNIKTVNSTTLLGSGDLAVQSTLVSGTNIKTINSSTILGSGDVALQTPLVSGTSIKTVNSTSLLGSGDVAVQSTLVSGTNIKTINGSSILGSGNLTISGGATNATQYSFMEHFLGNASDWYFGPGATSNGGIVSASTIDGVLGAVTVSSGTTSSASAYGRELSSSFSLAWDGTKTLRFRFLRGATDFDGTNQGGFYIGAPDSANTTSPKHAICFKTQNGGNLFAMTSSNYATTLVDLGFVMAASTWYIGAIVINAASSQALFYVDGTLVATITTNIPISAGYYVPLGFYVAKQSAHVVNVGYTVDYFQADLVPTNPFYGATP